MKKELSIICAFYEHYKWLHFMMKWFASYPLDLKAEIIIIDDGSSRSILDEIKDAKLPVSPLVSIYRIKQNIPWNSGGAYNLGTTVAKTDWILKVDFDHFFSASQIKKIIALPKRRSEFYKFQRRNYFKDKAIKIGYGLHLVSKRVFWKAGGYDEDFSGHIGCSAFYIDHLKKIANEVILDDIFVFGVNPTEAYPDCSTLLDRNPMPNRELLRKKRRGQIPQSRDFLRFDWERIL